MLSIFNSLTKQKQLFKPINPGLVNLYVCGMTVYDYCHLGHARVLVSFDVITRYLRASGYKVNYIRNITDIDDKIINRANENQEPFTALTERFITAMHEDISALNILPPSREPRATAYIDHMVELIQKLLAKGLAYIADNGDVYYDVSQFSNYGKLAHQDIDKLRSGIRVAVVEAKHDPLDFVLWKLAKPDEPSWDSPWGKGRPGWHTECSAMSMDCLGEQFDIHGGGLDLTFPHHENEIAQSEGVTGHQFVNTWMHVGYLQIDKEKMSKSLNNFFTIREVLQQYPAEVLRYFIISSHYRSPLNYSTAALDGARSALDRCYIALRGLPANVIPIEGTEYEARFNQAMDDDFNTPDALAVLFDLVREINRARDEQQLDKANQLGALLRQLGDILGILQADSEIMLRSGTDQNECNKIEDLIRQRNEARQHKNWQEADRVRAELTALGVIIEDSVSGTSWRKG